MQQAQAPTMREVYGLTSGTYDDEPAACRELDAILEQLDLFIPYPEVRGYYVAPRLGQNLCTPRIDRILVPKPRLIQAGWEYGPIGIECKRSGLKLGPVIAQLLDYSRAVWEIKRGYWIMPEWLLLWRLDQIGGPVESIMAQNRIGWMTTMWNGGLILRSGQTLARLGLAGDITIGAGLNGAGRNGRKAGSR